MQLCYQRWYIPLLTKRITMSKTFCPNVNDSLHWNDSTFYCTAVLRIRGVYSGSEFFLSLFPDPRSKRSRIRIRIKEYTVIIFNPKNCHLISRKFDLGSSYRILYTVIIFNTKNCHLSSRKYDLGSSYRILFFSIPDPTIHILSKSLNLQGTYVLKLK